MNHETCQTLEEQLVDFADDALTGIEAERVGRHVAQCSDCRATVDALRQSLRCAQAIWQDNARPVSRTRRLPLWRWPYLAAAGVLLAVGALLYRSTSPLPAPDAPTLTKIEDQITASAGAARLLIAAGQLETQPSLRDVVISQYQYIVEKYPDTAAAAPAHLKLKALR